MFNGALTIICPYFVVRHFAIFPCFVVRCSL
jgi:hypothetical protein